MWKYLFSNSSTLQTSFNVYFLAIRESRTGYLPASSAMSMANVAMPDTWLTQTSSARRLEGASGFP